MGLEERQSNLENEMHTAKDTIWRLTNRVVHLEKEVKTFKKLLIQSSTDRCKVTSKKSVIGNISKSAKLAEIARRKQKLKEWRESAAIASTSRGNNDSIIGQQTTVKEEVLSDTSDADLMSDYENCDPHFPNLNPDESDPRPSREQSAKVEADNSDSDSDGPDDSISTPGRNRSKIWRHFHTKTLKGCTERGRERILAICKHCKKQVSPKSDRLRNHIKKCLSSPKSSADVSWSSLDRALDASIEDLEASYLMDMDSDSNHALDTEAIATALAQSTFNAENNVGRKKGPVWKHFATVTTVKSTGQLRIHAICKKCKKEVSPKSDRLRNHVIKCNIPQVDLPAPDNPSQQPILQQLGISEPVAVAVSEGDIKNDRTSIAPDQPAIVNIDVIQSDAVQQNDLPQPDEEVSYSEKLGESTELPVSVSPKQCGIKKGPVWQHFSTSTLQTAEGHTRILVTCNYCKKEVSPKSDRLKKHIEKGHGISIPNL